MAKKLTIEIPDDLLHEIDLYCKTSRKESASEAVVDLLKSALTLPEYFRNFDWEKAEKEADELAASGKVKTANSVEELVKDLES